MLKNITVVDLGLLGFGLYLLRAYLRQVNMPAPLPPGPRGLPVVGNVADMPAKKEWLTFAEWGRKWGGICSVTLMGQPLVIINSADVMEELDKKGAIYSDRPRLEMGGELVGYNETLVLIPYGPRFRTYRKHFARYLGNSGPIEKLHPLVETETRRFLKLTLKGDCDLMSCLRTLAGGIILGLTYGYQVQERDDPFVNLIEHANGNFNAASIPGAFIVDFFPILRSLPEFLPGMSFMETARQWRKDTQRMVDVPYNFTKDQMAAGTAPPSFVSTSFEAESSMTEEEIRDLKFTASSMYGGGADTTVSAEYAFFLAMVLNPEVQKKAQAEIDAVVGNDRLPTLSDLSHLPYINAVVTEVLRWNSVAPLGVPHRAVEDDIVNGFFIPKGTIIMANLWNMLHDPETYPDPFTFDPERYTTKGQRDPRNVCFGYGRRICPGRYLAEASLFSTVSMSLSVFNIEKALDDQGTPITPVHENTSGTISYPEPFKCIIKPRSAKAIALVSEEH